MTAPQPNAAVSHGRAATQSQKLPLAATGPAVPAPTMTFFVAAGAVAQRAPQILFRQHRPKADVALGPARTVHRLSI